MATVRVFQNLNRTETEMSKTEPNRNREKFEEPWTEPNRTEAVLKWTEPNRTEKENSEISLQASKLHFLYLSLFVLFWMIVVYYIYINIDLDSFSYYSFALFMFKIVKFK